MKLNYCLKNGIDGVLSLYWNKQMNCDTIERIFENSSWFLKEYTTLKKRGKFICMRKKMF